LDGKSGFDVSTDNVRDAIWWMENGTKSFGDAHEDVAKRSAIDHVDECQERRKIVPIAGAH
jgi:hypothetical protein